MASVISENKVIISYSGGSYSFNKIALDASVDNDKMYQLATILNSFQSKKPPTKIRSVVTQQII